MKYILSICLLFSSIFVIAQPGWYAVILGDTVVLNISGQNGTIQWQESDDSSLWTDIIGATTTPYNRIATACPSGIKYFRAKITNTSICENASWYSTVISYKILTSTVQVQIGDWFHGGIVYFTDGNGNGNVATTEYQASGGIQWGCFGQSVIGATSTTDGASNTAAIVAYHDGLINYYGNPTQCYFESDGTVAAKLCDTINYNRYNDWFLPAIDQLDTLYQQRALFGGFPGNYGNWSSTESDSTNACYYNFGTSSIACISKYGNNLRVRCIRTFNVSDNLTKIERPVTETIIPVAANFLSQPASQNKCYGSNTNFSISASGTPPHTYQWKKDGVHIIGETSDTLSLDSLTFIDESIYSCEVTNLCRTVVSDNAILNVVQLNANAGNDIHICSDQNTTLSASAISNHPTESGNCTYSWSPFTGLSVTNIYNPNASPTVTTDYTVQTTDLLGCTASDVVNVFVQNVFQNEEICLVSVDEISGKNKITWNKTSGLGTDNYNIYREVSNNIYNWLGSVSYNDPSDFIDITSSPEVQSYKYKITATDTCLSESNKSPYHQTLNLTVSQGSPTTTMVLQWNAYVDQTGNFEPLDYYIYRGTLPSNMTQIASVPGSGSNFSYNDLNVFDVFYYKIVFDKNCNNAQSYSSNLQDNSTLVNIDQLHLLNGTILIAPNPMTNTTTLTIPNFNTKTTEPLQIMDITGKTVKSINFSNAKLDNKKAVIEIERGELKPGVYFVELKADRTYRGKLIIE